jgi:Sec-independent protein translocase protein TatA
MLPSFAIVGVFLFICGLHTSLSFVNRYKVASVVQKLATTSDLKPVNFNSAYSFSVTRHTPTRLTPLRDLLGLGPAEIALTLVVALVLFGPETLKSLSKDFGRAAAELKEIPKTFKEGMEEGAESAQVAKMKAIAAEKRKKRDEKLNQQSDNNKDENGDAVSEDDE